MDGETIATAAVRDISERAESEREKALWDKLQRARRLESVGQPAGGIAHDFNNILGVIMNFDLRASRLETVERLARAIEMHDPETGRHIDRMASIAAFLGERLGLDAAVALRG
jgi:response regulator RpfG family c-di-GMP phosphodiesterase